MNVPFTFRFFLPVTLGASSALLLLGVWLHVDQESQGDTGTWLAESPADPDNPFLETRRERSIRLQFREPILLAAAEVVSNAKHSANNVGPDDAIPAPVLKRARQVYQERCAACHGDRGDGNGPGASYVKPKPRDYTDPEWQRSVTDSELADAIVKGGTAVGKSYMMPANRDLKSKPQVVKGIVWLVRSFAQAH